MRHLVLLLSFLLYSSSICDPMKYGLKENEKMDLEIFHISDIHGYLYGNVIDLDYDVWLGDLKNYVECRRRRSTADLFLILDTGDLTQGTGLSDISDIPGKHIYPFMDRFGFDATTLGNHDTMEPLGFSWLHNTGVFDSLITSNVLWRNVPDAVCGGPDVKYFGKPYRVVQQNGLVILVLGFHLKESEHSRVCYSPLDEFVDTPAFAAAMEEIAQLTEYGPDLVISLNHLTSSDNEFQTLYKSLRQRLPNTALMMLCGHSHTVSVGWCDVAHNDTPKTDHTDDNCVYMVNGYYMNNIGRYLLTVTGQAESLPPRLTVDMKQVTDDQLQLKLGNLIADCNSEGTDYETIGETINDEIYDAVMNFDLLEQAGYSSQLYAKWMHEERSDSGVRLFLSAMAPGELFQNRAEQPVITPDGKDEVTPGATARDVFWVNSGTVRSNMPPGPILYETLYNYLPFKNQVVLVKPTFTGRTIKAVYDPINSAEIWEDIYAVKYPFAGDLSTLDDDGYYNIISTPYDALKICKALSDHLGGITIDYTTDYVPGRETAEIMRTFTEKYMRGGDCGIPPYAAGNVWMGAVALAAIFILLLVQVISTAVLGVGRHSGSSESKILEDSVALAFK